MFNLSPPKGDHHPVRGILVVSLVGAQTVCAVLTHGLTGKTKLLLILGWYIIIFCCFLFHAYTVQKFICEQR